MESDWIQIVCWNRIVKGVIIRNSPAECWGFFADFRPRSLFAFSFTSRIATHSRSKFVAYPKTVRSRSLHEMGKKTSGCVGNLWNRPDYRNFRQKILMKRKVWPCSLLLRMICFGFVKPICWPRAVARWPFPRKDSDPCVCAKISGIATGQTLQLVRRKYLAKGCSTSK